MIEFGDCRNTMRKWAAEGVRVQTCVTSPPYFGLRDYKVDGQIGLEQTPDEYVAKLVEVFRCVRDVLADDGTVWVNLGDSYARAGGWSDNHGLDGVPRGESGRAITGISANGGKSQSLAAGCKTKDLIGIPWRVAFALQADGWYLRQDIIWHKPNPMPESVRDRCTKAHEYIFLLAKSEKYFCDMDAVKEPAANPNSGETWESRKARGEATRHGLQSAAFHKAGGFKTSETRNRRSVWTVTTKPYSGAHFATFPPDLIEPCILAGAPVGGVVLDPFMGSGTTAAVAIKHKRKYLGCELNPEYKPLQDERIKQAEMETAQMELL
jgi:DNA modification methylase